MFVRSEYEKLSDHDTLADPNPHPVSLPNPDPLPGPCIEPYSPCTDITPVYLSKAESKDEPSEELRHIISTLRGSGHDVIPRKLRSEAPPLHLHVWKHKVIDSDSPSKIKFPKKPAKPVPKASEDSANDKLYNACLLGELDSIKALLDEIAPSLTEVDEEGRTLLYIACIAENADVVELLIQRGFNVNHQDKQGKTPLHIAFEHDAQKIAPLLVNKHRANYRIRDKRNWTPLHYAIDRGYLVLCKLFLKEFYEKDKQCDVSWLHLLAASHLAKFDKVHALLVDYKAEVNHISSAGHTSLYVACRSNNVDVVQILIEHGADPNIKCVNNSSACHAAVEKGFDGLVKWLLEHCLNIDLNLQDSEGNTCLHVAVYKGSVSMLKLLGEFSPMDCVNSCGCTPLQAAICIDDAMVIKELLTQKADPNAKDNSCLLFALHKQRSEECIRLLLEAGADATTTDTGGDTSLHLAIHKAYSTAVLDLLLQHGALLDARNNVQDTPLMIACDKGQLDNVRFLLEAGASPDEADCNSNTCLHMAVNKRAHDVLSALLAKTRHVDALNACKESALFCACKQEDKRAAGLLLEASADPDLSCTDNKITSLHAAVCNTENVALCRMLLRYSKNVNKVGPGGHTALSLACSMKKAKMVQCLVESRADPNILWASGDTCLHDAVFNKQIDIIKILLNHPKLDINAVNNNKCTALYIACIKSLRHIAKLLMEKGANLNQGDEAKNAPLHMAILGNALDIVTDLLEHGADINQSGQSGMTPLYVAVNQGSDEAVRLLLERRRRPELNKQNCDGDTPLHVSSRYADRVKKTIALLERGADPECKNVCKISPFDYAVRTFDRTLLEAYLTKARCVDSPSVINHEMYSCETALHYYCKKGNRELVKVLLDHGADKDKFCRGSPLDFALDKGHVDIVCLLIERGANVSSFEFIEKIYRQRHLRVLGLVLSSKQDINLTATNRDGETLFFQACKDASSMPEVPKAIQVIDLLLKSPRDIGVNIPNKLKKTPVYIVCENAANPNAQHVLSQLMQEGHHKVDVSCADFEGKTALHITCVNNAPFMANLLLCKDKSLINVQDVMERTPLHFAQSATMVDVLVQMGADLDGKDYIGQTPLLFACQQGAKEVASALINKMIELQRGDLTAIDHMGRKVTHHCAASGIVDTLQNSHDFSVSDIINDKDNNEQSALHIGVANADQAVAMTSTKQLLDMKADPNVTDKSKLSPIHMAANRKMYDLLESYGADTKVMSANNCSADDMLQWFYQLKHNEHMQLWREIALEGKDYLTKIMMMPLVGFIETHRHYRQEYEEIKGVLRKLMKRLSEEVVKIDPLLEFKLMPSGSMNEGTKVCMPDEGDFICVLVKLSKMLQRPKNFSFQPANVMLKLSPEYMDDDSRPDFVDCEGRVLTKQLFHRFYNVVQKALAVKSLWTECPQLYRAVADDITKLNDKISPVNLIWHGNNFKWMKVSVDVVPGIVFDEFEDCNDNEDDNNFNDWRPSWCEPRAVLKDNQHWPRIHCSIVAKNIAHAPKDKQPYLLQLGFTDADREMFQRMSSELKDGYKLAKLMRQPVICHRYTDEKDNKLKPASDYISSYMLKTVTFHLYEEYMRFPEKRPVLPAPAASDRDIELAVLYACKIYDKLTDALKAEFLEMYWIPGHDLFRNHYKSGAYSTDRRITLKYCHRIQNLLQGKKKDK